MKKHFRYFLIGAGIIVLMGALEYSMGRVFYCTCGYIKLWHGMVNSSQNSQQIFDWYSFTHIIHGMLWYLLLWAVDRKKRLSFTTKLLLAIGIEASWEVIENSSYIINRYRAATISLDYFGDSVVNSTGDVIAMLVGFWFAAKRSVWLSVGLFVLIEVGLAIIIRDNLTLNILMLIHPINSIKLWQSSL